MIKLLEKYKIKNLNTSDGKVFMIHENALQDIAREYLTEQLQLNVVSNRRELLIDFLRWYTQAMGNNDCPNTAPNLVDLYIKDNL